jgi:4-hydroxy-tetrahydrodipicolinate synthase
MNKPKIITAIGTPLVEGDRLHEKGLAVHLQDQWSAGVDGILIAGSMGMMQLLSDTTYQQLVRQSVQLSAGQGELFVGAGDAGYARTKERIEFVNEFDVQGVVILSPYLFHFNNDELVDYFHGLADISKPPLYLYDLPGLTGVDLSIETLLRIFEHPNIAGIKSSGSGGEKPPLIRQAIGESKRILVAQPNLIDMYIRHGFTEHLDGIYCVAPKSVVAIARSAAEDDWEQAGFYQQKLSELLALLRGCSGIMSAFSNMMNARGLPGRYYPQPYHPMDENQWQRVLNDPVFQYVLTEETIYDAK